MKLFNRLQNKLGLLLFVMAVMPTLLVAYITNSTWKIHLENTLSDDLESFTAVVREIIRLEEENALRLAVQFASDPLLIEVVNKSDRKNLVNRLIFDLQFAGLDRLIVTDANGIVLATGHNVSQRGDDLSTNLLVLLALASKKQVGLEIEGDRILLSAVVSIRDQLGEVIGTLKVSRLLDERFADRLKEITGANFVIYRGSTVIATSLTDAAQERVRAIPEIVTTLEEVLDTAQTQSRYLELLATSSDIEISPLHSSSGKVIGALLVQIPRTEIDAATASTTTQVIIVIIITLTITAGTTWYIARAITRPISRLTTAATRVAAGDLSAQVRVESRDEIGTLATAFNNMAGKLQKTLAELSKKLFEINLAKRQLEQLLYSITHS
jgi:nitrogen fixation/metabolism regulation signal transduction histidine kinase